MAKDSGSILIIGLVWPEPKTTAAGGRMLQLIRFFIEQSYQITFASTASETEYSFPLDTLGVKTRQIQLNNKSFNEMVRKLQPDVVLFDRFLTEEQFGWRVAEEVPNAIRILDTEDLHSLRSTREKCFRSQSEFTIGKWLQNDITKREIAAIYRCDLSLIISSFEMELLTNTIKMDNNVIQYLPFQLEALDNQRQQNKVSFKDRKDFICLGNGKHAPNVDAVGWLKTQIWSQIRENLPDANLYIYGAYLPKHILQMHNPKQGFYVMGWVEDVGDVIGRNRVNLAPLRFGAGIKGKLTDAMLLGTPSVTTSIGAEGLHQGLSWGGRIADDTKTFVKSAIELYTNAKEWEQAQRNGWHILDQYFTKENVEMSLLKRINGLRNNLGTHRSQNFVGSMLMHQTMASTKYMSKWIEEKNRGI